jgi:hypothetical protein
MNMLVWGMSNVEARMSKEARMTKHAKREARNAAAGRGWFYNCTGLHPNNQR